MLQKHSPEHRDKSLKPRRSNDASFEVAGESSTPRSEERTPLGWEVFVRCSPEHKFKRKQPTFPVVPELEDKNVQGNFAS